MPLLQHQAHFCLNPAQNFDKCADWKLKLLSVTSDQQDPANTQRTLKWVITHVSHHTSESSLRWVGRGASCQLALTGGGVCGASEEKNDTMNVQHSDKTPGASAAAAAGCVTSLLTSAAAAACKCTQIHIYHWLPRIPGVHNPNRTELSTDLTSHLPQNKSFRRRSSQPTFWLGTKKLNPTKRSQRTQNQKWSKLTQKKHNNNTN